MYIKLTDYTGTLQDGDALLMSHDEFVSGGKNITGVPVSVTPDGSEPVETEMEEL